VVGYRFGELGMYTARQHDKVVDNFQQLSTTFKIIPKAMHFLSTISLLLSYYLLSYAAPLTLHRTSALEEPKLDARQTNPRLQFFDITEDNVNPMHPDEQAHVSAAFRQAISLANAALRIGRDDGLFSIFFRDNSNYNEVMGRNTL
jgi:hypothetical protein